MKQDPPSPVFSTKDFQALVTTQQTQLLTQHTEIQFLQQQHREVLHRLSQLELKSDSAILLPLDLNYA